MRRRRDPHERAIDVEPGRVYEWYAEVTDCAHTVRTPVMRFTTSP